jgi:hypothetical protein
MLEIGLACARDRCRAFGLRLVRQHVRCDALTWIERPLGVK